VAAKKASNDDGNASDFIRAQPVDMTAPEVVEAGKKAGFDFSASLVYAVRGRMKKGPASSKREAAPSRRGGGGGGGGANVRLEAQIQDLVGGFVREMSELVRRAALDAVRHALGERSR
jgi:hypothetical protein